jgi:peptidoglycan/LPS O-acetylase OafA/YrhL
MRYRADIDGLRAVAVIPVVLFHAGFSFFRGGYIGVDVFFVISGYLITSIIKSEIDTKSFSTATFYQRRIRRIFPALTVVILFCLAVGFVLLTPGDYLNLGESVLATAFFVSNIFFWQQSNYFDTPAAEKPLLHTWSLSIEEQFYLCYPWILIFLSRFPRRIQNLTILLAFLLSFAASAVLVYAKPSATFYLGPTRAWELLFGGLIALRVLRGSNNRILNRVAAGVGSALVLFPVFFYSTTTRFPGVAALPPVIGTGLLIWSGLTKPTFVHRLLSIWPVVAVGRASYSLYLWHFPILAFAGYAKLGGLSTQEAGILCMLSLGISFASLQFVERPFRFHSGNTSVRRVVAFAALGMSVVVLAGTLVVGRDGFPARMTTTAAGYLSVEQERETRHHWECMSLEKRIVPPSQACRLGLQTAQPNVLLWGDSHSVVTATALEQSALRNKSAFLFAASVDCPIGTGFSIDARTGPGFVSSAAYQYCGQYDAEMLKLATVDGNIKAVVLSSRWTNWRIGEAGSPAESPVDIRLRDESGAAKSMADNRAIFARGFETLVRLLTAAGKTVWIVGPLPEPSVRIPKALYVKRLGFDNTDIDIPRASFLTRNSYILSLFEEIARKYPVRFIWPHIALCSEQICAVVQDGKPLYFDSNHLSLFGVSNTSTLYDPIFASQKTD